MYDLPTAEELKVTRFSTNSGVDDFAIPQCEAYRQVLHRHVLELWQSWALNRLSYGGAHRWCTKKALKMAEGTYRSELR